MPGLRSYYVGKKLQQLENFERDFASLLGLLYRLMEGRRGCYRIPNMMADFSRWIEDME